MVVAMVTKGWEPLVRIVHKTLQVWLESSSCTVPKSACYFGLLRDRYKDEIKRGVRRGGISLAFYFDLSEEAASCSQRCCDVSLEVASKTGFSDSRHSGVQHACNDNGAQLWSAEARAVCWLLTTVPAREDRTQLLTVTVDTTDFCSSQQQCVFCERHVTVRPCCYKTQ